MKAKYILLLICFSLSLAGTPEEWKQRSVYQLLTDRFANEEDLQSNCDLGKEYCGGTYKGIIKHLDYIKNMGFDAIWISPIVKNKENSYHGYHLIDLYDVNEHFGTREDLINFVEECHKKDIWVMVDVVANHVADVEDFSTINPFNKEEYYHDRCDITDWNNQPMVEYCRLSGLPDLKTEHEYVSKTLIDWIQQIVKDYKFDGVRIDTMPEVPKWFWNLFSKSAGVFTMGEVFNARAWYVSGYQGHADGVFNYPLFYTMRDAFCGNSEKFGDMMKIEEYISNSRPVFKDPSLLGVFFDNHDNKRFLNMCPQAKKSTENMAVFTLFWEGIPFFYYGDEQYFTGGDDPHNRETLFGMYKTETPMYKTLSVANKVRKDNKIWELDLRQRFCDSALYAFTRGEILIVVGRGDANTKNIQDHDYKIGTKLCNVFNKDDCVTVTKDGIEVKFEGDPKIYIKQQEL